MVKREQHQLIVQHKKCGVEMEKFNKLMRLVIQMIQTRKIGEQMGVVQVVNQKINQNLKLLHSVILRIQGLITIKTIQLHY